MNSFISDCAFAARMMRAPVRDEDDNLLTFWEKLVVAWQILCGIIEIEHVAKH